MGIGQLLQHKSRDAKRAKPYVYSDAEIDATPTYLHAHLALKENALAKLKPYEKGKRTRFRPNDRLLAFLEAP
jgi:hypothetical protein